MNLTSAEHPDPPTRFERVLEAWEGTFGIATSDGQFFGWVHCRVDEWDNICGRGITWLDDWKYAKKWKTRASALRMIRTLKAKGLLRSWAKVYVTG